VSGTFRVGEWLVAPQLNRVECNGHSVRLEPKVMEVLVCLCQAKGEPVSKEHLLRPKGIYFTGSGAEELVTREPGNDRRVSAEGIYLIGASDKTSTSYPVLKLFSFATRRAKIVGRLDKAAAWTTRNLAISPDGRVALYTQFDDHSQVIMVAKGLQL
jgi:hypothetical protein